MTWTGYLPDLVLLLVFGGAAVTAGAVKPYAVVPGDVLDDGAACHCPGGPGLQVDEFALGEAKNDSASALSQH